LNNVDSVRGVFQKALDAMGGRIDVLVNCAGIQRRSPSLDFLETDWDDVRPPYAPRLVLYFSNSGKITLSFNLRTPAPTSFVYPDTHFDLQVLDVNLKSVWLLSQAAGRHMVPRRQGKIINFCSLLTFQGGFTVPAYAAAKGALGQLTKALSNEWSQHNVQVNGICPGYIATDM
jgi:2-dehydro-3-deoxy-D-gluconate 5-dehydrogenase